MTFGLGNLLFWGMDTRNTLSSKRKHCKPMRGKIFDEWCKNINTKGNKDDNCRMKLASPWNAVVQPFNSAVIGMNIFQCIFPCLYLWRDWKLSLRRSYYSCKEKLRIWITSPSRVYLFDWAKYLTYYRQNDNDLTYNS